MLPTRSSGRKRWNLHVGPTGSLRRLRNQLAEDGCPESQVVLAKQLLDEECELEADKVANFKQAIEWLICATEQGHQEARKLLKRCVRSGVISENSATVVRAKSCLAASRQENAARKAARDLFASISNGEEYITVYQLEQRIRQICDVTLKKAAEESERSEDDSPDEHEGGRREGQALQPRGEIGESVLQNGDMRPNSLSDDGYETEDRLSQDKQNLTVENLVSAAVNYCQGELPLTEYRLTLTEPSRSALDHIPILHQAFLHPILFSKVIYLKLLHYFTNFSLRLSNFELTVFLLGYFFFASDYTYNFLPLLLYYSSFAYMIVCTFRMLNAKREFVDFRKWSGLFLRYSDGNLDPDESENLFVRNNLQPFLHFFFSLLVNLLIYPFIADELVAFSDISTMSFLLMFLTLFSFGREGILPDFLALISFSINVLAKYPYEKDTVVGRGWRFLDFHIQTYPSYVLGDSIEFCLNAKVFFSMFIPVILFLMSKRNNFSGFFRYTVPHLVTLSWLQVFIIVSQGCTMYGLVRGTLRLVCVFLFLPIMGLVTLFLPIFVCVQSITLSEVFYGVAIVGSLFVSLVGTCVLAKLETTKKYITPIQVTVGIVAFLFLSSQLIQSVEENGLPSEVLEFIDKKSTLQNYFKQDFSEEYSEPPYISWQEYYTNCNSPSWIEKNVANTQLKCAILSGVHVNWQGQVVDVKLKSVKNNWKEFAQVLPGFLNEYFKCYYGEEYSNICGTDDNFYTGNECDFMRNVAKTTGKLCHLNSYDIYTFDVTVRMEISGGLLKTIKHTEINLSLENYFTNISRMLHTDDIIRFKGMLQNDEDSFNIGSQNLNLQVYEIACVSCKQLHLQGLVLSSKLPMSKFEKITKAFLTDLLVSAKYVLNLILNPVVVLK